MPGFDGTGPRGEGSMTGGGRGLCSPYGTSYMRPGVGRGMGLRQGYGAGFRRGRGFGRGFGGRGFYPAGGGWSGPAYIPPNGNPYSMSQEDEISMLKDEADAVGSELNEINRRIEELEKEPKE